MFSSLAGLVGYQPAGAGNLANDTPVRMTQGLIFNAVDPWWGGGELVWGRATAAIRAMGLVQMLPVFDSALQAWRYDVSEAVVAANSGRMLGVAMGSFTTGQYGWFMISGITPINMNASVAADAVLGVAATGQAGANVAGRQILNARNVAAGAATVAKAGCVAQTGSNQLVVPNSEGWFVGGFLSGTGIAAGTTILAIDSSGRTVTLSAVTTAQVNGTVTLTYNNGTIFFNVAHINRPFHQGAIT